MTDDGESAASLYFFFNSIAQWNTCFLILITARGVKKTDRTSAAR
jgi:hypothetical protein